MIHQDVCRFPDSGRCQPEGLQARFSPHVVSRPFETLPVLRQDSDAEPPAVGSRFPLRGSYRSSHGRRTAGPGPRPFRPGGRRPRRAGRPQSSILGRMRPRQTYRRGKRCCAGCPRASINFASTRDGFADFTRTVAIHSAVPQPIEVALELGVVKSEITVQDEAPLLDPGQPSDRDACRALATPTGTRDHPGPQHQRYDYHHARLASRSKCGVASARLRVRHPVRDRWHAALR